MEAEDAAEAELEEEVDSQGVVAKDEMLARRLQIAEQFRIFTPPASTSSKQPLLVQPPPGLTMIAQPKSGTLLTVSQMAPFVQHSSNVPGSTLLTQAPFPHGMNSVSLHPCPTQQIALPMASIPAAAVSTLATQGVMTLAESAPAAAFHPAAPGVAVPISGSPIWRFLVMAVVSDHR